MSLLGTLLRPKSLQTPAEIAAWTVMAHEVPCRVRRRSGKYTRVLYGGNNESEALGARAQDSKQKTLENIFIRSLVAAGSCRRCAGSMHDGRGVGKIPDNRDRQRRRWGGVLVQRRCYSTQQAAMAEQPLQPEEPVSREAYRELVNTYDSPSDLWEQPSHVQLQRAPTLPPPREHIPLAPRLVITPEQEDRPPHAKRVILPPEDSDHREQLKDFNNHLGLAPGSRIRRTWNKYQNLRSPRPRYLRDNAIRRLFRHLAWVEFPDFESSQRYFSFLDECLAEGVPVEPGEWNTAIAFAARWLRRTTSEEMKTAIETWMRMEKAGVQATNVTFNILFDAAARAGRFALADTIFNEIKVREMPLDRHFRRSMIFYAGLRRDGDAVRQAFRDLVNGGEIVDTSVMNCVILSLVRAGEAASAENVFAKMKQLHQTKFGAVGPRDWRERRASIKELNRTAQQLRRDKEQHESSFFGGSFSADGQKEEAQRAAPIHPDAHTCRILIKHHAYYSGNLDRCRDLLAETKQGGWRVHGSVYMYLFRGFWVHGGHAYTAWNRRSLEEYWEEFLQASSFAEVERALAATKAKESQRDDWGPEQTLDDLSEKDEGEELHPQLSNEDTPPYFTPKLAERALYAFYKCAGRKKMLQVWAQIQERWEEMSPDDRMYVEEHLERLVRDDSKYDS